MQCAPLLWWEILYIWSSSNLNLVSMSLCISSWPCWELWTLHIAPALSPRCLEFFGFTCQWSILMVASFRCGSSKHVRVLNRESCCYGSGPLCSNLLFSEACYHIHSITSHWWSWNDVAGSLSFYPMHIAPKVPFYILQNSITIPCVLWIFGPWIYGDVYKFYGLLEAIVIGNFDLILITLSYTQIFITVFHLSQKEAHFKEFDTCIPHICIFFQFQFQNWKNWFFLLLWS